MSAKDNLFILGNISTQNGEDLSKDAQHSNRSLAHTFSKNLQLQEQSSKDDDIKTQIQIETQDLSDLRSEFDKRLHSLRISASLSEA